MKNKHSLINTLTMDKNMNVAQILTFLVGGYASVAITIMGVMPLVA
jgi:hypothetical protein